MSGLAIARTALVVSVAVFALCAIVLKTAHGPVGAAFWMSLVAVAGIVLSATGCVTIQMLGVLRKRVQQ